MFNSEAAKVNDLEIKEVTKEELMAKKKVTVIAERAARVTGIGLATIGAASGFFGGMVKALDKILDGCDEEHPAGFLQAAATFGTGVLVAGTAMIEKEVESWSDEDFMIEEAEETSDAESEEYDPDKRIYDWK